MKLSAGDAAMASACAGGASACSGGASACSGEASANANPFAVAASGAEESRSDFVKYGCRAIVSSSTGGGEIQSRAPSALSCGTVAAVDRRRETS